MATGIQYAGVTLLAPFLLEDELYRLTTNPSKILDYRITESLSEAVIRQTCSYIFEGIPLTKLSDGIVVNNFTKLYDNNVLPKEIPLDPRTKAVVPHKWNTSAYQSFYSELILESGKQLLADNQVVARCFVLNANYIKVLNNTIIEFSPLLQNQIDTWSRANDNRFPQNSDVFGTAGFKAKLIRFEEETGTSLKQPAIQTYTITSDLINLEARTCPSVFSNVVEYFALVSESPELIDPVIGIMQGDYPLEISKEGGSYSSTTVTDTNNVGVTVNSMTDVGPLIGQARPNWIVYITYPNNIIRTAQVDSAGNWSSTYPVASYTPEELGEILVRQQDLKDTSITSESVTPAIVQKSYGLPILKFKNSSFYSLAVKNAAQITSKFVYSTVGGAFRTSFKANSNSFALTSFYIGRPIINPRPVKTKFLSWPGSVIQSTGVDIYMHSQDYTSINGITPVSADILEDSALIASVSISTLPYQTDIITRNFAYETERLEDYRERLTIPYEVSYDFQTTNLRIRYEKDYEERFYTDRLKTSYEVELVRTYTEQLRVVYEVMLPEDRVYRDFLSFSWEKDLTQGYKNILQTTWAKEKTFFTTVELETSWETILVNEIVIKPFYVKQWDANTLQFHNCISFNVYGDAAKVEQFILNNELRFLFTNPPKFELIMFDYNLNPYSNVFLSQINDPLLLQKFDDVPDRYTLIGNYTIKDIDMLNSFSLDVIAKEKQLNEYRSYWIPEKLEDYKGSFLTMSDGKSTLLSLDNAFRDDHHEDIVELDLIILDKNECCFTQSAVGSRCSPY